MIGTHPYLPAKSLQGHGFVQVLLEIGLRRPDPLPGSRLPFGLCQSPGLARQPASQMRRDVILKLSWIVLLCASVRPVLLRTERRL